jgi:hypothetical protein
MRRIGLIALVLVSVTALSGAMASTSMARTCVRAEVPRTGSWADSLCTKAQAEGEYVKIQHLVTNLGAGQWCAEVEQNEKGTFKDAACTLVGEPKPYTKVWLYQHWQRNGELLAQGETKQIKLQVKGTAILSAPNLNSLTIECTNSASVGSTIESQGKDRSGQGKGRISYEKCKTNITECKVAEPILTNQIKSHLALSETTVQGKLVRPVEVFEPTETNDKFVELKLSGSGCGLIAGSQAVEGNVAAEIAPEGAEVSEGLLNFPKTAIKTVYNEQAEVPVGLKVAASSTISTFSAAYGAQLASGEAFGVGG